MSKKLYIKTYGCQMNVYDSIKMGDLLKPHGFAMSEEPEGADMVILNTCHIREKASEKVYSELGRIRKEKDRKAANGEKMIIAVAGCVAQAEGEEIFQRAPFVDIVVGSQSYHSLPKLIEQVKRDAGWAIDLDFSHDNKFDKLPAETGSQGVSAFLSVQEGCDKFCHFCVVPYTRGAEYSRSVAEIYREAIQLVSVGAREIHLLGQNVSAFHGEGPDGKAWSLGKLIKHLAKIDGIERIRYMTSHPRDMVDEELFEAHAMEPKLMPFLHLPVQSGSTRILEMMNRKHSREHYFEVIEKFRNARPDMAFSSDFIVGYPGETDKDFEDTMDLVRRVNYSQCYSFKYSPRPGTPASMLENQVNEEVKNERLYRLQELIREQQTAYNAASLGKSVKVLFDKVARNENQVQGKSEHMQAVFAEGGEELIGCVKEVLIDKIESNSIGGKIKGE
jgi:tRNA-2-methylthio-N6-dimethylallyladenosine synthase